MTDTADHADYVLPATTQLEHLDVHTSYGHTYALINEPAIAPLGEALPNTEIFRELAARMGFDDPCFADSDESLRAQRLQAGGARRLRSRCARTAGVKLRHRPRRRSPTAASRRRAASASSTRPALRRARPPAQLRIGRAHAGAGRALSAGDDLAAGAQLPQLDLRQRRAACATSRASRCSRSTPTTPRRAASPTGADGARLQRPRRAIVCKARGRRARPAGRGQRARRLVAQARRRTAATSTS